jgi:tetratricopeptide (TPR) repeat protein
LNCIGIIHYTMPHGDSNQALDALKISLRLRQRGGQCDSHVGTTLNNLGRVYFQRGDYERAMQAYQESLHIRQVTSGGTLDVTAVTTSTPIVWSHPSSVHTKVIYSDVCASRGMVYQLQSNYQSTKVV